MYTLRLTRPLLRRFAPPDPADGPEPETTTRLGDWYANTLDIGRARYILCTSERSFLSLVVPAKDLAGLPERLVVALIAVLHALEIPSAAVADEVDRMTTGRIGPTRSRVVLGVMNSMAFMAEGYLTEPPVLDLFQTSLRLADDFPSPLRGRHPGEEARRLLLAPDEPV